MSMTVRSLVTGATLPILSLFIAAGRRCREAESRGLDHDARLLRRADRGRIGGSRCHLGGNRDLHYVEALPSYMLKLRNADIYLIVGLELDMWWNIVLGSRNSKLKVVDCSEGIEPLEVPTFKRMPAMATCIALGIRIIGSIRTLFLRSVRTLLTQWWPRTRSTPPCTRPD